MAKGKMLGMGVVVVGAIILVLSSYGAEYKKKPIPSGADAFTWRKYGEAKKQWHKKILLDAYDRCGGKNEKWDGKVWRFLGEVVEFVDGGWDDQLVAKLKAETTELMGLGCTDPFIVYWHGNLLHQTESAEKGEPFVRRGLEGLEKSSYPPISLYAAAKRLALISEQLKRPQQEIDELTDRAMRYLAQATADEMFKNGNERYIMEDFDYLWGRLSFAQKGRLVEYLSWASNADPWIAACVRGNFYSDKAWKERGSGWAYTVTEEGRKGFKENMGKAKEELTKAYQLHPSYPEAATAMISVAMGTGGAESEREWFDRAVAGQMDYRRAYDALLWALRPRWHGSHAEMYDLGLDCLKTGRFDTEVPRFFLKVVWDIGSEMEDWREAYRKPGVYDGMKRFFEGVLKEPSRKAEADYFKSLYAVVSWAAGRYDESRRLYDELGEKVSADTFANFNTSAERVRGEVNAHSGAFKDQVQRADRLVSENKMEEAQRLFEESSRGMQNDALAAPYLRGRAMDARMRNAFQKGEWVRLMPEKDFAGWERRAGDWSVEADGTVKGVSTKDGLVLLCDTVFEGNFEIVGEIEAPFSAGLVLGYTRVMGETWVSVRTKTKDNRVFLTRRFYAGEVRECTLKQRNEVHVQVWDSRVTVSVNGVPVFRALEMDKDWWSPQKGQVGMGGYYENSPGFVVKYRNLRIRRLEKEPK